MPLMFPQGLTQGVWKWRRARLERFVRLAGVRVGEGEGEGEEVGMEEGGGQIERGGCRALKVVRRREGEEEEIVGFCVYMHERGRGQPDAKQENEHEHGYEHEREPFPPETEMNSRMFERMGEKMEEGRRDHVGGEDHLRECCPVLFSVFCFLFLFSFASLSSRRTKMEWN